MSPRVIHLLKVNIDMLQRGCGSKVQPREAEVIALLPLRLRENLQILTEALYAETPQTLVAKRSSATWRSLLSLA